MSSYYKGDGELEYSHKNVAWQYAKTWMILDLVACIPTQLIEGSFEETSQNSEYNSLLRLLRLPRLYRLIRIVRIFKIVKVFKNQSWFQSTQNFFNGNPGFTRLFHFFISVILITHLTGCLWYFTAKLEGLNPNTWVMRGELQDDSISMLYISSIYWSFTTLTTVGYGDITART